MQLFVFNLHTLSSMVTHLHIAKVKTGILFVVKASKQAEFQPQFNARNGFDIPGCLVVQCIAKHTKLNTIIKVVLPNYIKASSFTQKCQDNFNPQGCVRTYFKQEKLRDKSQNLFPLVSWGDVIILHLVTASN